MTPTPQEILSEASLSARSLVDRLIEEFVDTWVMHAFLMPTNIIREDYKTETIQKLEILIQMLEQIDFDRVSLTEWDVLDTIDEEKSSD